MPNETARSAPKMRKTSDWQAKQPWKLFGDANVDPRDCVGKRREGGKNPARYLTKSARVVAMQAIAPLLQMGYRHAKVAEILGLTSDQVKRLVSHRDFPVILGEYQEKMLGATRDALMASQIYAVWTLMDLLGSGSDYVRVQAANALLVHGKIMDQISGQKGSDEQTLLLAKLSKELDKPRQRVEVTYIDGRLQLKRISESRRAPREPDIEGEAEDVGDVIEGEAHEVVDDPPVDGDEPERLGGDVPLEAPQDGAFEI